MKLKFNKNQKVAIKNINQKDKVINFIEAVDTFLKDYPLSCFNCEDNCCSRGWNIELDIVFYNRLLQGEIERKNDLIIINNLHRPVFNSTPCPYLNKAGLCNIYKKRPFICRGYICYQVTEDYKLLRDFILDSLNISLLIKLKAEKENKPAALIARNQFEIKKGDILPFNKNNYYIKIFKLIEGIRPVLNKYRYKGIYSLLKK